jgi:hypothetical protein
MPTSGAGPNARGDQPECVGKSQAPVPLYAVLEVRIHLPPGESPLRTWTADDSGVLGQCRWETEPSETQMKFIIGKPWVYYLSFADWVQDESCPIVRD